MSLGIAFIASIITLGHGILHGNRGHVMKTTAWFKHELNICNAFPAVEQFDVVFKGKVLTGSSPLKYLECRSFFDVDLQSGDKMDFRLANSELSQGTFTVWEVPQHDATMLLVVHRRKEVAKGASFLSHIYAPSTSAQVAVIYTYGSAKAVKAESVNIDNGLTSEELKFDSVAGVGAGSYTVSMTVGDKLVSQIFTVAAGKNYVVLRAGWEEPLEGGTWPQQLVVYPGAEATTTIATTTAMPKTTVLTSKTTTNMPLGSETTTAATTTMERSSTTALKLTPLLGLLALLA